VHNNISKKFLTNNILL